jgi:hypothetical protein
VNGKFIFSGPAEDVKISLIPAHLQLLPVKSREGKIHTPLASHEGKPMEPKPATVAQAALSYYEGFLADAEKFFVR